MSAAAPGTGGEPGSADAGPGAGGAVVDAPGADSGEPMGGGSAGGASAGGASSGGRPGAGGAQASGGHVGIGSGGAEAAGGAGSGGAISTGGAIGVGGAPSCTDACSTTDGWFCASATEYLFCCGPSNGCELNGCNHEVKMKCPDGKSCGFGGCQ